MMRLPAVMMQRWWEAMMSADPVPVVSSDLWVVGANWSGQLGLGDWDDRASPVLAGGGFSAVAAGGDHAIAVKDGEAHWWGGPLGGQYYTAPHGLGLTGDFASLAANGGAGFFLMGDGRLFAIGVNQGGQLGVGDTTARAAPTLVGTGFTAVAAGRTHTLALKGEDLYAWGTNQFGQVGTGDTANRTVPTHIGNGFRKVAAGLAISYALATDGRLFAFGRNAGGDRYLGIDVAGPVLVPTVVDAGFTDVACCGDHVLALKNDALYSWGMEGNGCLGLGTETAVAVPTLVGTGYSAIVAGYYNSFGRTAAGWRAWGSNWAGELWVGDTDDRYTPTPCQGDFDMPAPGNSFTLFL